MENLMDSTENKAEDNPAPRLEAEMMRSLLKNLPGMAYRCIDDSRWSMIYVSEGCIDLTGYTPEELVGNMKLDFIDLIVEEDRDLVRQAVNHATQNQTQYRMQYRIRRKSGEIIWVWELGYASYCDVSSQGLLDGFISDITLLKRQEEALQLLASDLKEHNSMKDKFFGIIAHDLQNPIYAIVSIADFMEQNKDILNQTQILDFCSQIHTSAQSINCLLENLLEWSRMKIGQIKIQPRRLALVKEISEAMYQNSKHARDKDIELVIDVGDDFLLCTDQRMLASVLRNVISNAIKYSDYGQRVLIRSAREDNESVITISDNGVGMSRMKLAALFRIDEDIDSLGTANETGSGLGMILVKTFLDRLGAKIKVESKVGKGTAVTIRIPDLVMDEYPFQARENDAI